MFKKLLYAALILCCANLTAFADGQVHNSLTITLDPGETLLVKSADGKYSTFIEYSNKKVNTAHQKSISSDESYHLEYHLIIWMQCPGCNMHYNAAEGGCRNPYCPQRIS